MYELDLQDCVGTRYGGMASRTTALVQDTLYFLLLLHVLAQARLLMRVPFPMFLCYEIEVVLLLSITYYMCVVVATQKCTNCV